MDYRLIQDHLVLFLGHVVLSRASGLECGLHGPKDDEEWCFAAGAGPHWSSVLSWGGDVLPTLWLILSSKCLVLKIGLLIWITVM